ncbi:nuclear transport factor 2 family protein, partial [Salmonella enterica subsp. arizonae]|nr:nuclear transport factor 2 family protein [Salmonella enterica subsp. arizonae]
TDAPKPSPFWYAILSLAFSFIHPRGHELGWSQIAENFYGATMGKTFSKRTLKQEASPAIHVYSNAAVAEFDWHFTAARRGNGQTQHTKGRESQVWEKIPNVGWRIVHIHYSGPAKTGVGEVYSSSSGADKYSAPGKRNSGKKNVK